MGGAKKRIEYIDIAKGIGIILVIMCHSGYINGMAIYVNSFFMPLFFYTAGLVYRDKELELKKYLMTKFKTLMVPYYVWNVLLILGSKVIGRRIGIDAILGILYGRFQFSKSSSQLLLHYNNSHMWFLPCMFLTLTIYWIIRKFVSCRMKPIVIGLLCGLGMVIGRISPIYIPLSLDIVLVMLPFLYLGHKNLLNNPFILKHEIAVVVILCILFCLGPVNGDVNVSMSYYGKSGVLFMLVALSGTYLLIFLSEQIEKFFRGSIKKILLFCGKNSMTIYGIHIILITVLNHFFSTAGVDRVFRNMGVLYDSGILSAVYVFPVVFVAFVLRSVQDKLVLYFNKRN